MLGTVMRATTSIARGIRCPEVFVPNKRMMSTEEGRSSVSQISLSSLADRVSYSLVQERWMPMFKSGTNTSHHPPGRSSEPTTNRSESTTWNQGPPLPELPLRDASGPGMTLLQGTRTKMRLHWHSAPRTVLIVRKPTDKPHPKLFEICK